MAYLIQALDTAMMLEGAIGVAIVDVCSGTILLQRGGGACLSLTLATTINSKLVRANQEMTSETESISLMEDILVTFDVQYHIIRPVADARGVSGLFFFLALDRKKGNLAMARRKLGEIESELRITPHDIESLTSRREGEGENFQKPSEKNERHRKENDVIPTSIIQEMPAANSPEELPPFLRDESVLRLLGLR
jgi:hypothetical protein